MSFEPLILAFACNWCAYAAADLAGSNRLPYPASLRIVRVMCSGMVHPNLVVEAFHKGADGVLVMGCHLGECHYQEGNKQAASRLEVALATLETLGLEPERLRLLWCSSTQAEQFAACAREMTETVKALGPSPYNTRGQEGAVEGEVASCR